jgi:hypothetical protein
VHGPRLADLPANRMDWVETRDVARSSRSRPPRPHAGRLREPRACVRLPRIRSASRRAGLQREFRRCRGRYGRRAERDAHEGVRLPQGAWTRASRRIPGSRRLGTAGTHLRSKAPATSVTCISTAPFVAGSFVEWILLPAIPGQSANQVISAYVRGATTGIFPIAGSVEIRYSPSGGTSTGTTTSSVGDFTQLLTSNSNGTLSGWDHLQVPIPGTGRWRFAGSEVRRSASRGRR